VSAKAKKKETVVCVVRKAKPRQKRPTLKNPGYTVGTEFQAADGTWHIYLNAGIPELSAKP